MKNFIVLDTETAPTKDCLLGECNPYKSNVYDLGYIICTESETIERSFIITDTFFNHEMMKSAYYAEKVPKYQAGLYDEWQPVSMLEAWRQFQEDCKDYDVKEVWAYNMNFDMKALSRSMSDCSNGFRNWFFPYKMKFFDIWDYAGSTICDTAKYIKWCDKHGYISDKGNPQTTAERVYQYLTGKHDFEEKHTALQDCMIELEILKKIKKRKQKKPITRGQGWRKVSKRAKILLNN